MFTLLLYGIRNSLLIATVATVLTTLLGVVVGITAGYSAARPTTSSAGSSTSCWRSPALFFIAFRPVVIAIFVGPEENTRPGCPPSPHPRADRVRLGALARLLRGQVLALREREFVEAAR